jgi:hypothetical protein
MMAGFFAWWASQYTMLDVLFALVIIAIVVVVIDRIMKWRYRRDDSREEPPNYRPVKTAVSDDDVKPFRSFAELEAAYKAENDAG